VLERQLLSLDGQAHQCSGATLGHESWRLWQDSFLFSSTRVR